MTGDNTRLPFGLLFSIRSHFLKQPFLTAVTVIAISLSVALAVAMQMSAEAIREELKQTAESLQGAAQLEVTSGAVGLRDELVDEVVAVPGVRAASPVIETTVRLVGGDSEGLALHVLGVDLLVDQDIRQYSAYRGDLKVIDPVRLIATPDAVIVTYKLADRLGLKSGGTFDVWTPNGKRTLTIRGILESGGIAEAYGSQLLIMDVYNLQALLNRQGWIDRIDVVLESKETPSKVAESLDKQLSDRADIRTIDRSHSFISSIIATLMAATNSFTVAGLLSGLLVAFGAFYVSVERRKKTFALLRATGIQPSKLRMIVVVESFLLAALSFITGIAIAKFLAISIAGLYKGFGSFLNLQLAPSIEFKSMNFVFAASVALLVSVGASLFPIRRLTSQAPMDALKRSVPMGTAQRDNLFIFKIVAAVVIVLGLLIAGRVGLSATSGASLVFLLLMAMMALVASSLVRSFSTFATKTVGRSQGTWIVTSGFLKIRSAQNVIAVLAITGVLAVVTSTWIIMFGVADTIQRTESVSGETMITAGDIFESMERTPIPDTVAEEIARFDGVDALFRHYLTQTSYRGETIGLSAGDYETYGKYGSWPVIEGGTTKEVTQKIAAGGISIDQAFAFYFDVEVGDSIALATPKGTREFSVVAIVERYSFGNTGSIRMSMGTYDALWSRPGISNILIWPKDPESNVVEEIQLSVQSKVPLFFTSPEQLESESRDIILQASMAIYLLMMLTATLGGISVLSVLSVSIAAQRQDYALLASTGFTSGQLVKIVLAQGGVISTIGVMAGMLVGVYCAHSLVGIFTEFFGWKILLRPDVTQLAAIAAVSIGVCVLASVAPAVSAARTSAQRALVPE